MKLFVLGRNKTAEAIQSWQPTSGNWLWFHCASLGEFEQALPLIEELKKEERNKIIVTFFSPSGYEQKKNHKLLDAVFYLPIDTPKNAREFVQTIKPKAAFFIKYEFWENFFAELNKQDIPIYMVSSTFRDSQVFFKWYGGFFKDTLKKVSHFFVQNQTSLQVLQVNGFTNVSLSGDTRFDRVYAQLSMDNQLAFIDGFIQNRTCVVFGSTWPACEAVFIEAINNAAKNVCFIIAPHEIKKEKIAALKQKLTVKTSVFSEGITEDSTVLIMDAIGYLTRIYSYADIAYIGGAIGNTGLHNILEPAVFGIPILVGPNVGKFPEATALQKQGGLEIINTSNSFSACLNKLIENEDVKNKMATSSKNFIKENIGATKKVLEGIRF